MRHDLDEMTQNLDVIELEHKQKVSIKLVSRDFCFMKYVVFKELMLFVSIFLLHQPVLYPHKILLNDLNDLNVCFFKIAIITLLRQ